MHLNSSLPQISNYGRSSKRGRPSKLNPRLAEKICFLAKKGFIDKEICQLLDIAESTLNEWKKKSEFSESLKDCKGLIDRQVQDCLLSRALGLRVTETKKGFEKGREIALTITRELPPDPVSCIFWLKNRQPQKWRAKIEEPTNDDVNISLIKLVRLANIKKNGQTEPPTASSGESCALS